MKKTIRLTESELMSLVKKVILESNLIDVNNHRYETSPTEPGFETFLNNPIDQTIKNGFVTQLERDKYGKGKLVIIFNNRRFDRPTEFVYFIQEAYRNGICYKITNYEYKNRSTAGIDIGIRNTKITILASQKECNKKVEQPLGAEISNWQPEKVELSEKCEINIPKPKNWKDGGKREHQFIEGCLSLGWYRAKYTDGTKAICNPSVATWNCCTMACHEKEGQASPFQ